MDHPELTHALRRHLRAARAEAQPLPDCPQLQLYLLNPDYPQQALSREEIEAIMHYPAYWAFCWASGQVMARYLLDNPELVRGRCVVDFGSGSGVAGIAAAQAGADRVIACDIDPDAQLASMANAELNGVDVKVCGDFFELPVSPDVILVADVLYDRENFPWLARFLSRAPRVLLADSRVKDFREPGYRRIAQYTSCTLPDLDESEEFRQVNVYLGEAAAQLTL